MAEANVSNAPKKRRSTGERGIQFSLNVELPRNQESRLLGMRYRIKMAVRVFIRHRRSENSPPTTQNSPAKFWWPGAQLYISFIQTWNRYVVENYIWRKRYLFFQEDIHRTRWTNNSSFLLCTSLKVVILLKQACHGHCTKMRNFNVIPTWLYMPK